MDFTIQNQKDTRSGFGEGLLEAGRRNPKVVAFCADLTPSLKMGDFAKEFPNRFFQTGIAEANMINMAAGMALSGFVPFTGTFAAFSTGRVYDQIRQSVAYSNKNVKIAASHAGVTLGEDGATHQILEDIGMMKMLPNMTVIVPCDFNQTKNATLAAAEYDGPVYLRFGRPKVPNFTPVDEKFVIGKAQMLQEGTDVSIFACGHLVWKAIQALPMTNFSSAGVKFGTFGRPKRKYTGPSYSAAAMVAFLVWLKSQGTITVMLGSIFIMSMSSRIWCVAPSSPRVTPAWEAASFTFLLE